MRRTFPHASLQALLALVPLALVSASLAAPATSDELSGPSDSRAGGVSASQTGSGSGSGSGSGPGSPVVTGVTQSRSVELLLQLQDQPQQAASDGRGGAGLPRKAETGAVAPAPAGSAATEASSLASLKNALLRDAVPRASDTDGRPQSNPAGVNGRLDGTGPSGDSRSRRGSEGGLLSHPVIRYIRENRLAIASVCVAVLAGIWLTAHFSLRRRR